MLQRFSEEEATEVGAIEGEDIVIRVRGVGGERSVGGEKSENTRKPQDYIRNKTPSTHGNNESDNTVHQTQPIKHSPMKHISSRTIIT